MLLGFFSLAIQKRRRVLYTVALAFTLFLSLSLSHHHTLTAYLFGLARAQPEPKSFLYISHFIRFFFVSSDLLLGAHAHSLIDVFDEWQILGMVEVKQRTANHILW